MPVELSFSIPPEAFDAALRRLVGDDVQPMPVEDWADDGDVKQGLRDAGQAYLEFARRRFIVNSRGGGEWPPLAESTILRRVGRRIAGSKAKYDRATLLAAGAGLPILIDRGDLLASLRSSGANNVLRVVGLTVTAGTADPKAEFHQFGGPRLPRRAVAPDPDTATSAAIERTLSAAVERAAETAAEALAEAALPD